jgi:hypothetical protein
MESILVKIKAKNTIEIPLDYGYELNRIIKEEFEIKRFINSGFFGQKGNFFSFKSGEFYYFRLVFLRKEEEKTFAKKLFTDILKQKKFSIKKFQFKFQEIIYRESKWTFSHRKDKIYNSPLKISFHSPVFIKFGSEYLRTIDKKMFFKKLIKNYEKLTEEKIDKRKIYEILDDIDFQSNVYTKDVKYKNYKVIGLKGEIVLKNNSSQNSAIKEYSNLLETTRFLGLGDSVEDGFGQILIEEIN